MDSDTSAVDELEQRHSGVGREEGEGLPVEGGYGAKVALVEGEDARRLELVRQGR